MKTVTCVAPINMAVIKYWGKRDEELILPLNDSLSGTISTDDMYAKTTVMASPNFKENKFWLNGKEESSESKRLNNCLKEVKKLANNKNLGVMLEWNVHICSENNFPTAAGLASSSAGYSCLVSALATLYGIEGDLTALARRGSGSACRSMFGGWVHWCAGTNSTDSIAKQIAPAHHWSEMRLLILVVNDQKKTWSSTGGMQRAVETSTLLKYRADVVVPQRIEAIKKAILTKDFHTFAELTMRDSNQLHAICLDTYPPCIYMNDISKAVVEMIHAYNNYHGCNKVAYTFDAGPNACLYLLEQNVERVLDLINHIFPPPTSNLAEYMKGMHIEAKLNVSQEINNKLGLSQCTPGSLKNIIYTKLGDGPKILNDSNSHLLNENGFPKNSNTCLV